MLRIASYNIRFGGKGRERQIADVIRACDPDIVVLQEATDPSVVKIVSEKAGMRHHSSRKGYSVACISRLEIEHFGWHEVRGIRRSFMEIRPAGTGVTIFGVHLSAVHSNLMELKRRRELSHLLRAIESYRSGFHLLTGDFNTLAPGERLEHKKLPARLRLTAWATGGRVRYRTIQMMLDAGYSDA